MHKYLFLSAFFIIASCKNTSTTTSEDVKDKTETAVDNTDTDLSDISTKDFREFKVLDSKNLTKSEIWENVSPKMDDFTEADYNRLKAMVIEKDIPTLQKLRSENKFTYEELVKFYLYRIRKYDRENDKSLNSVIAVNPNVIAEAQQKDREFLNRKRKHKIFGMPILLKDNINASGMATTAGALALKNNTTEDAFIVEQLKEQGALILGKANLSEWAYFFCGDCPSGYSAIGGQTLNPYGRRVFDTGGSSSGSGASVAANFAVAAIGSETSGSILSPSSQNSVVGLKPTIGLVSRSGIVPISSTLDTAGPMTKFVVDNAIVLDAMFGEDESDSKTIYSIWDRNFYDKDLMNASLEGKRFGAPKRLMENKLYVDALDVLKSKGAEIVEIDEESLGLPNFIRLLNVDMKRDLPAYLENYANKDLGFKDVDDIMAFNLQDSLNAMPYGQRLFEGISADMGDDDFLEKIRDTLYRNGKLYFDKPLQSLKLDGFLSINNFHAGFAAVAEYPAITVPMGYDEDGEPKGLTFISIRLREKQLLEWAYVYEQASKARKAPTLF
ncbi:amidase family protein [Winogradskyella maritima]|uniref:Amidase family protein n=1 Tax=Winogradskyella maritima TaxID=1517766 RepID=A0ABV8AHU7_9FLAO|nr:amidase family protein [Winogradskyella maritima]